jgi:polyphosphate kinase
MGEQQYRKPEYFFNREQSWIEFNRRVLREAQDERIPLLERLKFSAIFSNNLDEFFMVRVAALKQQVEAAVTRLSPDGLPPQEQLRRIHHHLGPLLQEQQQHFSRELRPQLAKQGVHLLDYSDLSAHQQEYLKTYFESNLFPVLTPLAVDPAHPFPFISNLSLNLAVIVSDSENPDEPQFARVKVPSLLPRLIELPLNLRDRRRRNQAHATWMGVPMEQVIGQHLDMLFPGMEIQSTYTFRVTRDADIAIREDEADDLLLAIEQELRKRRLGGSIVRLEVETAMPQSVRDILMNGMGLAPEDVYEVQGLMGIDQLMSLAGLPLPELKDKPWTPVVPKRLWRTQLSLEEPYHLQSPDNWEDIFTVIRQGDILVHHPYESFAASTEQFIFQAANDPNVLAIKMTLYRTTGDASIITSLMQAAENGKQVLTLVELKARFDEENNITWARRLEKSGVHVVYGVVGLKTHTKIVLVVRQEEDGIRRYVHIGTGNYNPKTAKFYTDLGLLSCRDDLGADLSDLFNFLTGFSKQKAYRSLLVAPVSLRQGMLDLIEREIAHARAGRPARIFAKMNALVDPLMIAKLYEASEAGVPIDLIVRGMCCLKPGIPGLSETIYVHSVIGRFLEHSRIFWFLNGGEEDVWLGSADWMPRNLDRRVEAVTPVQDLHLKQRLKEILDIYRADNCKAWKLLADGSYQQLQPNGEATLSAQLTLMRQAAAEAGPKLVL